VPLIQVNIKQAFTPNKQVFILSRKKGRRLQQLKLSAASCKEWLPGITVWWALTISVQAWIIVYSIILPFVE